MILRVTIENLFSFKDETEISFVAGKGRSHSAQVSRAEKRSDLSVLKTGVVYGANASGKSNIIKAIAVLQKIALSKVPTRDFEPFKFSSRRYSPSKVQLEFKVGRKYYAYGAEFSIKGVFKEWLYEINSRSGREIFTRSVKDGKNVFSFGVISGDDETRQRINFISLSTPITYSFLSEYVKRNLEGIAGVAEVYNWMKDGLKIIFPYSRYQGISIRVEKDKDFADATNSLLEYFNTGIVGIRRIKIDRESIFDVPRDLVDNVLADLKPGTGVTISSYSDSTTYFIEEGEDGEIFFYKQNLIHKSDSNENVSFEMREESDGSIRLLDFIPMLIDLRLNDAVYLIDEIDRSMHPMLSEELLKYYFECLSKDRDTQLIFTTHESNLLDMELVRADEVWFVEKGKDGASHLTSLAEYKPRKDVRKSYLQGRYGAIPFFASTKILKW